MSVLKTPTSIVVLGSLVLLAVVGLTVRERQIRAELRRLPAGEVALTDERRTELEAIVARTTQAIADDVNNFGAYTEFALAKTDLGDRNGAAEVYRQMNQRFPGNFLSFQNLGKLYEDTGRYELAAEQYLIAIDNAPRNAHMYRNLVNLYTYHFPERRGDIPRILEKGLAIVPGSIDHLSMLAIYHRDFGDLDQAIAILENILVHDQENEGVLAELKQLKERRAGAQVPAGG